MSKKDNFNEEQFKKIEKQRKEKLGFFPRLRNTFSFKKKEKEETYKDYYNLIKNEANEFQSKTIAELYKDLITTYTEAKYIRLSLEKRNQWHYSFNPHTTLNRFLSPFRTFILSAIDTEKNKYNAFDQDIKNFLISLTVIAKAHQNLLGGFTPPTFQKPSGELLLALQLYINDHYLYALITFRNDIINTKEEENKSYPALEKVFVEIRQQFIFRTQKASKLLFLRYQKNIANLPKKIITLQARGDSLESGKSRKHGANINKLCARPRSNPKSTHIERATFKKDEFPYYMNTVEGPINLQNFEASHYFTGVESIQAEFNLRLKIPKAIKLYKKQKENFEYTDNKILKLLSIIETLKKLSTEQVEKILPEHKIPTSGNTNRKNQKERKKNKKHEKTVDLVHNEIDLKKENYNTLLFLYNRIIKVYTANQNSDYLKNKSALLKKRVNSDKIYRAYRNPISGLINFANPFKELLLDLQDGGASLSTDKIKNQKAQVIIARFFESILNLTQRMEHDLEKYYSVYQSPEISLYTMFFYNGQGLHAARHLYRQLRAIDVHNSKLIKPILSKIREKILVFNKSQSFKKSYIALYNKLIKNNHTRIFIGVKDTYIGFSFFSAKSLEDCEYLSVGHSNLDFFNSNITSHIDKESNFFENSKTYSSFASPRKREIIELHNNAKDKNIESRNKEIKKEEKLNNNNMFSNQKTIVAEKEKEKKKKNTLEKN